LIEKSKKELLRTR